MKRIGIKVVQNFILGTLCEEILKRYKTFQILDEADLQCHVWQILNDHFMNDDITNNMIRVLNKPYFKEVGIHPDIVIFKRNKPWIIIELKEWKKTKPKSANKEFERIINAKKHFYKKYGYKLQRGYLLYVARKKEEFEIPLSLKPYKHYIHEVAIIQKFNNLKEQKEWENKFKQWSKYKTKPKRNRIIP